MEIKQKAMKATLVQMDIAWEQPIVNRQRAEELMQAAPASDLYVLPEMFTTGFAVTPGNGIEPADGDTLVWLKAIAHKFDAAVTGSVAVVTSDGERRNRLYFVTPDGNVHYYDKHHLFTYGGEQKMYSPGEDSVIVEWRGVRFFLQVCYDLRFPVFSRNRIVHDDNKTEVGQPLYDCAIYVANWPDSRRRVWNVLTHARAIENQCYVLAVNRVGNDPVCRYDGGTIALDAYGKDMAMVSDGTVGTVTVELDMQRLDNFRKKFPVLLDGDI